MYPRRLPGVFGHWVAITRWGPGFAPMANRPVTRLQVVCFSLGAAAVWIAADWPVHDIAEQHNYSLHGAAPHPLDGGRTAVVARNAGVARPAPVAPGPMLRTAQALARFFPALVVFNLVLVFTHWPALVNFSLSNGFAHFGGSPDFVPSAHRGVAPDPESVAGGPAPLQCPPMRMAFLFLESVVPTVPASFMTYGGFKVLTPTPQDAAVGFHGSGRPAPGRLIMKIGAGIPLWLLIAVIFFRCGPCRRGSQEPSERRLAGS